MRAGNAFSELSNNKPNSNSINKTINTRNNKTSSRIDLEQTDTQNSTSTNQLINVPNSWYRRVYKIREFPNYCEIIRKFETLNHISEPVRN